MRTSRLRFAAAPIAALLLLFPVLPVRGAEPALRTTTIVSTVSGTGAVGFADGKDGTFVMPTGVAYDASGAIYVSDGGAQRIRRVERDGTIRTIAGGGALDASGLWVPGGYADGRGAAARFDRPAGLALRSDGSLYVADTLNHCIRRIDPSGLVTTYAGDPKHRGHRDGPAESAEFGEPTGLAVDAKDTLYVADYTGIRTIDRNGVVATIPDLGDQPFAVAVIDGPHGVTVFAGDQDGIVAHRMGHDPSEDRAFTREGIPDARRVLASDGEHPIGNAAFMAALDENTVAYTELRTNTVRTLEIISGQTEILAGRPAEDGSGETGGYADGPGRSAAFFTPLGIARAPDGGLLVADAGNRRLRALSPTDRVDPWGSLNVAFPGVEGQLDPSEYRIAYVGNSYIYYVTDWPTSIQGVLQARLAADPGLAAKGMHPKVVPVVMLADSEIRHFAEMSAQTGFYDCVVLNLNLGNVAATFRNERLAPDLRAPDWPEQFTRLLVDVNRTLSAKHIAFVVLVHPVPSAFAPSEAAWYPIAKHFAPPYAMAPDFASTEALERAVARAGVPTVDMLPQFTAEERAADHVPLFGTADYHFTAYARRLVADALAERLTTMAPWRTANRGGTNAR